MIEYIKNLEDQTHSAIAEDVAKDAAEVSGLDPDAVSDAVGGLNFASYLELGNAIANQDGELIRELLNISDVVPDEPIDEIDLEEGVVDEEKLLDKPTPSLKDLAKKHDRSLADMGSQLAKGIKAEKEHTTDMLVAKEIALDHLNELPDYYDRLEKMEEADNPYAAPTAAPAPQAATPPSAGSSIDALAEPVDTATDTDNEEVQQARKEVEDLQIGDEIEVADIDGQPAAGRVRNLAGPGDTLVITGKGNEEHMIRKDSILSTPMIPVAERKQSRLDKTHLGKKNKRAERVEKKKSKDVQEAGNDYEVDTDSMREAYEKALGEGEFSYGRTDPLYDKPRPGHKPPPMMKSWGEKLWKMSDEKLMKLYKEREAGWNGSKDSAFVTIRKEVQKRGLIEINEGWMEDSAAEDVITAEFNEKEWAQFGFKRNSNWPGGTTFVANGDPRKQVRAKFKLEGWKKQDKMWWKHPTLNYMSAMESDRGRVTITSMPVPSYMMNESFGEETHADMVDYWKQSLSSSIVSKGVFTELYTAANNDIDELNAAIADQAESIADSYHGSGEGIGSSDVNHFIMHIGSSLGIEDLFGWNKKKGVLKSREEMDRDMANRVSKYRKSTQAEGLGEGIGFHFFVDPLEVGANVMNSKGEIHDHYDSEEEALAVAKDLNAQYGEVDEGKWDYNKRDKGKGAGTTSPMHDGGAQNRKNRKAFRKAEKAKAHQARMRGEVDEEFEHYGSGADFIPVIVDGKEVGVVWQEGEGDWHAEDGVTGSSWGMIDSYEDAVNLIKDEALDHVSEDIARIRELAGIKETASSGGTGAGAIASSPVAVGGVRKRNPSIYGQTKLTKKPAPKKRQTKEDTSAGIGRSKKA